MSMRRWNNPYVYLVRCFLFVSFSLELARQAYKEHVQEYRNHILPRDHTLTRHVFRVANRLLQGSNLGVLDEDNSDILSGSSTVDIDDPWSPAASNKGRTLQWKLLVVDDPKMINASASYGLLFQDGLKFTLVLIC
jgi:hypothetical protein